MAGVPPLPEGWPSLSELCCADYGYLARFAALCDRIAAHEQTLEDLAQEVRAPGGVEWEGAAGDAAITQADADVVKARPFFWSAADAAPIARNGKHMLEGGTRLVLDAVDDAQRDGFTVGEDYTCIDPGEVSTREQLAQRQAAAQAHSDFIRHRVATLVGNEQWLNSRLKQTTADWGTLTFEEPPGAGRPPNGEHDGHVQLVDWKTGPDQPAPPGDPFAGWTEEQKKQVAAEIAHGHAWTDHRGDFPREWSEPDLTRWVYESMNDPSTRFGTDTKSGALTLLRDGRVILIQPKGGDFGTAFTPKPRPSDSWRTPLGYFEQHTRAVEPLAPPTAGRLPPLSPGEISPRLPTPIYPPSPPAPRPGPPPPVEAPAPKPAVPPEVGKMPMIPGGPSAPFGPHVAPPPHAHPHWLGETPEEEWGEGPAGQH